MPVIRASLLTGWRRLQSIREQSRLLSLVILGFMAIYLAFAFWLFRTALRFINSFPGFGTILSERLLFILFAFLFFLLLASNLVIGYTNFFRQRETNFLLTLPLSAQNVFRWKLVESVMLASWAFLFLIAPMLVAYGLNQGVAWHFYPVTVALVGLFIGLPGFFGAWAAIALGLFLGRRKFQIITLLVLSVIIGLVAYWLRPVPLADDLPETRVLAVLDKLLYRTKFAEFPGLPSYWLSSSVMNWTDGAASTALFFALVLLSNVLFFGILSVTRTGRLFYEGFSAVLSRGGSVGDWSWLWGGKSAGTFAYPLPLMERILARFRFIAPDVRALAVKDARVFWRDTTQWGQTLVLFGLLGVYILNLRHFSQQLTNPFWINLVAYLNLGACALNLSTLTTRFVYPQFSLEGRRLWVVGMAPIGLVNVVRVKFWLTGIASWLVTLPLIILSCRMLLMEWDLVAYFCGVVTLMTFSLNALAVGLGTLFPNMREENPGKIVSGFGGTFCLVLSFAYVVGSVALLAMGVPTGRDREPWPVVLALLAFFGLSLLIGWLPYKLGLKRVAHFEI